MTDPIIRFDKVAKRFGDISVLDGLDFTVSRGEKVTIIGPSGSGKSTILRILMTLGRLARSIVSLVVNAHVRSRVVKRHGQTLSRAILVNGR